MFTTKLDAIVHSRVRAPSGLDLTLLVVWADLVVHSPTFRYGVIGDRRTQQIVDLARHSNQPNVVGPDPGHSLAFDGSVV